MTTYAKCYVFLYYTDMKTLKERHEVITPWLKVRMQKDTLNISVTIFFKFCFILILTCNKN